MLDTLDRLLTSRAFGDLVAALCVAAYAGAWLTLAAGAFAWALAQGAVVALLWLARFSPSWYLTDPDPEEDPDGTPA